MIINTEVKPIPNFTIYTDTNVNSEGGFITFKLYDPSDEFALFTNFNIMFESRSKGIAQLIQMKVLCQDKLSIDLKAYLLGFTYTQRNRVCIMSKVNSAFKFITDLMCGLIDRQNPNRREIRLSLLTFLWIKREELING